MKKLTRSEMYADAQRLMKAHGKKEVFATVEGSFFFAKNDAVYHNQQLIKASPDDVNDIEDFDIDEADTSAESKTAGVKAATPPAAKTAIKPPVKPAVKPAAKPVVKLAEKPADKKVVSPAATTEGTKPEDKPEDKV